MGFFQRKEAISNADDDETATERTSSTQNSHEEEEEIGSKEQPSIANVTTYVVPKKQQSGLEDTNEDLEAPRTANVTTYVVPKKQQSGLEDVSVDFSYGEEEFLRHNAPVMMTREGDEYIMYFLPNDADEEVPIDVKRQVDGCWFQGPLARVEGYYDSYHYIAEWFFKIACACFVLYLIFPTWYFHSLSFTFFAFTLYNEFSCILDMKASRDQRHWSSIYASCLPLAVGFLFYVTSLVPMEGLNDNVALRVDGYIFFFLGIYLLAAILLSSVVYWFHDHRFLAAILHYGPIICGIYFINTNENILWGVGFIVFEMVFGAALSIVPTWKSNFTPGFHEHIFHSAGPTTIFCNILLIMYLPLITMGIATYVFIVRCIGFVFLGMTPFTYALWKQNPLAGEFLGLHADFFTSKGFKKGILSLVYGLWGIIEYTFTSFLYYFRFTLSRGCNSIRDLLVVLGSLVQGIFFLINKVIESVVWFVGQLIWETCCLFYAMFSGVVASLETFVICLGIVGENATGSEVLNDLGLTRPANKAVPPELPYVPPRPIKPLTALKQYEADMADFVRLYGQEVADVAIEISYEVPRKPKLKQPAQIIAEGGTREQKRESKKVWKEYGSKLSEFTRWYGRIYGDGVTAAAINAPEMPASMLYAHGIMEVDETKEREDLYRALQVEEKTDRLKMEKYLVDIEEWSNLYDPPVCSCIGFKMKVTDKVTFGMNYIMYVVRSIFEYIITMIGFMIRGSLCSSINSVRDVIGLIGKLFQSIFKAIYDIVYGIFWVIGQLLWGIVKTFYDLAMGVCTLYHMSVEGIYSCFYHTQHNCFYTCYPYGNTYETITSCFGCIGDSITAFFLCLWTTIYTIISAPFIFIYETFRCIFSSAYGTFAWCYNGCDFSRLRQDCVCCDHLACCDSDCFEDIDCPKNPVSSINRRLKKCYRVVCNDDIESRPMYEIITSIGGKKITDMHPKAIYKSIPIPQDFTKEKRVRSKKLLVPPWSKSFNSPPQSKPPKGQLVRHEEYQPINQTDDNYC